MAKVTFTREDRENLRMSGLREIEIENIREHCEFYANRTIEGHIGHMKSR